MVLFNRVFGRLWSSLIASLVVDFLTRTVPISDPPPEGGSELGFGGGPKGPILLSIFLLTIAIFSVPAARELFRRVGHDALRRRLKRMS